MEASALYNPLMGTIYEDMKYLIPSFLTKKVLLFVWLVGWGGGGWVSGEVGFGL